MIRTQPTARIRALGLIGLGFAALACEGAPRAPVLSGRPDTLVFGAVAVGRMSPARLVEWTNAGPDSVVFSAVEVSGSAAADFVVAEDLCAGTTMAPDESCSAAVLFGPREPGTRAARIAGGGDAARAAAIELLGEGTGAAMAPVVDGGLVLAVPETLDFGEQPLGAPGGPLGLRLVNRRPGPVQFAVRLRADPSTGFRIALDRCSNEILGSGRACSLEVLFVPEAEGLLSGELVLRDLNGPALQSVPVSGTGVPTAAAAGEEPAGEPVASLALAVTPQSVEFGVQAVGTSGASRRVRVRNGGAANVVMRSLQLAGSGAASFRITGTDCRLRALYATRTCTLEVGFQPTAPGGHAARIEARTDGGVVPALVLLSGTGEAP